MRRINVLFARRMLIDQRGQVLPTVAIGMVLLLGLTGMMFDLGHAYVVRSQLQNTSNAAALAAAGVVFDTSTTDNAATYASQYSSGAPGNQNYNPSLGTVTTAVTTKCLNVLMPQGSNCVGAPSNAVQVTQTAKVKTYFMALFGVPTLSVAATATASMQGIAQPWNVAIVVDSTGSMATTDSNCGGVTEFQCALSGVQSLLQITNPACPPGSKSCPTGANFRVGLFTFPNVLTSVNGVATNSLSDDLNCNGSPATYSTYNRQPLAAPYTLPVPGATLLVDSTGRTYMEYQQTASPKTKWTATYQITPFLSDYYAPDSTSTAGLNASSDLVKAVGYAKTPGCLTYTFGIDGSSGQGSHFGNTYFASSIYAAQAALTAQQAANPGSRNALIFLSDGQANNSYYAKNPSAYGTADNTNQYAHATEFPEAPAGSEVGPTSTSYPVPAYYTPATSTSTTLGYSLLGANGKGKYPDWYDQCQQAIVAAQYAVAQGTQVYAVAYGAESSGCSNGWSVGATDTTLVATGTLQPFTLSSLLPCTTMENIASSWSNFYSDNQQTGNVNLGCADKNHSTVKLQDIFQAIAASFGAPRMLPNNAT